jgi:Predicted membrane-associated HD superfamily hydrolase
MLADSAEAAVRVLDEPTPERVREAVDFLVAQKIAAGQLREAPLTLRDLDRVSQEFTRLLAGMYHTRVEYPSGAGGITADFGRD